MNDEIVIEAKDISKKYCKSLMRSMWYGVKDIARNTIGLSSHSDKLRKGEFWAVDDISFQVKKGEILGIIGPNGSGKTTLLKMLNGIFWPDRGKITIKGRVGALIEVGAGFHPNLTGKENVFINGAILGMTKAEIDEKYDEIVEFAGIGDFINSPVKYYSSGMYVRLGFAVAVHCNQDILLVDEVLAVGDSAFQNKCLSKMVELKNREDLTIVMVSHHLYSIEKFCNKGIFLQKGRIQSCGDIIKVIRDYQAFILTEIKKEKNFAEFVPGMPYCTKEIEIIDVKCLNEKEEAQINFSLGDSLGIRVEYKAEKKYFKPIFYIVLINSEGLRIADFATIIDKIEIESVEGRGVIECWIDNLPLLLNKYYVYIMFQNETMTRLLEYWNGTINETYFCIQGDITSDIVPGTIPICRISHRWKLNDKEIKVN